jgi:hypothetical protein
MILNLTIMNLYNTQTIIYIKFYIIFLNTHTQIYIYKYIILNL